MPLPLLALALAFTSTPHVERRSVAGWTVTVRSDAFVAERSCKIQARTQDVVYRIDGGPPQNLGRAHLDPLTLSQDEALNNPSGGEVGLPAALLTGARFVWIRADQARRPVRFDVSRLSEALGLAARLNCPIAPADTSVR